ncbi:DHX37 [Symbiodinium microadriaticum]|nr:DHX37 [Symbiodinium microadriaticum]
MTANNFHVCSTCCGTLLAALQILLLVVPLQSSSTADTLTCSFESDTCFWETYGFSAWQRQSGQYRPSFGPHGASEGQLFLRLTASPQNIPLKDFEAVSGFFENKDGSLEQLLFDYYLFHQLPSAPDMGSLVLQFLDGDTSAWTDLWSASSVEGADWVPAAVDLPAHAVRVRFIGTTGRSPYTSIGLDALRVNVLAPTSSTSLDVVSTTSTAPTLTSTTTVPGYEMLGCDFEDDSCGWVCQSFTGTIVPFQLLDIDGWCMAYSLDSLFSRASVHMSPCQASSDVQRWYMLNGGYIRLSSGDCLDHDIDTGNLQPWTCHGGTNQQWYRDDALRLRSLHDHRCVEHNRDSHDLVLSSCTSASTQKFNTVELPDGVVTPSCAWNQISGSTPSAHTGPSAAFSGSRYIYLEASGWNHPSQEFTLESPVFEEGNGFSRWVYFSYHMYIDAMGSLKLQSYNGTNWTTEWALFGDQGDAWHQAFVALPDSTQAVRFLGKTGGTFRGDISLDAVGTSSSSSTFTTSTMTTTTSTTTLLDFSEMACGFETGLCFWAGSEAWLITEQPVPSLQSGPNAAFEGKRYVFLRAEGNLPEKEFFLESFGFLNSAGALRHMHFSYFLFRLDSGSLIHDVGSLTLQSWDGTSWIDLWTPGVAQATQWQRAVVPVPATASRLRFRAVTGTTVYSNIALDAVATALPGYDTLDCGFETDTCGYYAAVAGEAWLRQTGRKPSSSTGPSSASEGQYYMFVEASAYTTKPKTLILDSPFFTQGDGEWRVLSFSYHMYSSVKGTMGSLELQQYNGEWAVLWSVSGTQGDMWHRVNVSLPEDTQAVRFLGTTLGNYRGDIAIDDVKTLTMVPTTSTTTARVHSFGDVSCGFESDTCEWKADEAWKRVADSNAGPPRTVGRHYMYLDARGHKDNVTEFVLESARFMPADDVDFDRYLHFSYHLFGNVEDSLILLAWDGTNWTAAWSESGQQLHAWRKATVYLQNTTEILRFVAVARGGPGSLIAIDEVRTGYEVVACDFETDACGWVADGHYMYVAASASDEPNKEFKLESANFSRGDGSPRHFYFSYHLDAGNVASLVLQSWDGADWSNLWYRHGSAGDVWHLAHPQLPPTTKALRFVGIIRRNSSGVAANIAIDTLRTGEQDYDSISCGFEADACGWESLNWQRTSGSEAPTITGPSAASSDSLFMLGSRWAVLESMVFSESSRVARGLRFSYHIYHVLYDVAPMASLPSDARRVRFIAEGPSLYDVGLDDVVAIPDVPHDVVACSFEDHSCGWMAVGDKGWLRSTGSTPSWLTGPPAAYGGSYYLYVEASGSNSPDKEFVLESVPFSRGHGLERHIYFTYHMHGRTMGNLALQSWDGEAWTTDWYRSGSQSDVWHHARVRLPAEAQSLRFLATTGTSWASDIAIDHVQTALRIEDLSCDFGRQGCWWFEPFDSHDLPGQSSMPEGAALVLIESAHIISEAAEGMFLLHFQKPGPVLQVQRLVGTGHWVNLPTEALFSIPPWRQMMGPIPTGTRALRLLAAVNRSEDVTLGTLEAKTGAFVAQLEDVYCGFEGDTCKWSGAWSTTSAARAGLSAWRGDSFAYVSLAEWGRFGQLRKEVSLQSPFFPETDAKIFLGFAYRMRGYRGYRLRVDVWSRGRWKKRWGKKGSQGNAWQQVKLGLPEATTAVRFTASTTIVGKIGSLAEVEIAVDDVFIWQQQANRAVPAAMALIAGTNHQCALAAGMLKCWGDNSRGQLGYGNTENLGDDPLEVGLQQPTVDLDGEEGPSNAGVTAAGGSSARRAMQRSVMRWPVAPITRAPSFEGGPVKCFGQNLHGQLGLGTATNSHGDRPGHMGDKLSALNLGQFRIQQLAAGGMQSCALSMEGNVTCWGRLIDPSAFLGVRNVGKAPDEMGPGLPRTQLSEPATQITVRQSHACLRLESGKVVCFGSSDSGQLGSGEMQDRGLDQPVELDLGSGLSAQQVAAGKSHSCAVLADDSLKCWGSDVSGQLGRGSVETIGDNAGEMGDNLPPVQVGRVQGVSLGGDYTCALRLSDDLVSYGLNRYGEMGLGTLDVVGDESTEIAGALVRRDRGLAGGALQRYLGSRELPAEDGADQQHEIGNMTGKAAGRVLTELAQGTLGKDTWNATVPDDILAGNIRDEDLLAIASHGIASERTLQRLVLGIVAWKHRGVLEGEADRRSLPKADYLVEVANTARSALELEESLQKAEGEDSLLCRAGHSLRLKADELLPEVCGETERLDLGLFTARPGLWGLLNQSVPVIWLTQLALWPELMSKFLQMIRCMSVREDFGDAPVTVQRLRSHPDVVCWQDEHLPKATIAMVGLVLWCLGTPLLLFLRIWSLHDRQEPRNRRRYGYFIQGLEPNYWYWELAVKRLDIGLMLLIASTTIANDDKAKLLLFALISGMQLAVTSWVKPYDNSQAEVLDFLEFLLLGARFLLFTIVAMLLIFFPSGGTVWVWSVSLLSMLVSAVVYSALHIIAQALRNVAGQMEAQPASLEQEQKIVISDLSHVSRRFINSDGVLDKLRQSTAAILLPFLQPDSHLAFFWSLNADAPAIITRKSQIQGYRHRLQRSWLAKISTFLLRSSVAYQKEAVSKAYHDFIELWLSHFQGGNIPNVNVLCALAVACRALPDNVAHSVLRDVWKRETQNLVKEREMRWQVLADDFAKAVQMFALLRKDDANELVRSTEDLLKSSTQTDDSNPEVSVMEGLTSEDDTLDFDTLLDAGTAFFDTDSPAKEAVLANTSISQYLFAQAAYRSVLQIHKDLPPGSILVFVTGRQEVHRLCRMLQQWQMRASKHGDEAEGEAEEEAEEKERPLELEASDDEGNAESDAEPGDLQKPPAEPAEHPRDSMQGDGSKADAKLARRSPKKAKGKKRKAPESLPSDSARDVEKGGGPTAKKRRRKAKKIKEAVGDTNSKEGQGEETEAAQEEMPELSFALGEEDTVLLEAEAQAEDAKDRELRNQRKVRMTRLDKSRTAGGVFKGAGFGEGPLRVLPLYAQLSATRQLAPFAEPPEGERVVVIATNVAETSVTLPNVRYVVDTGKEKRRRYKAASGVSAFVIDRISKASADQRAGRAGRLGPGHTYRLYSSAAYENYFTKFAPIPMLHTPMDPVLLLLAFLGVPRLDVFPWPTPPPSDAVAAAIRRLRAIGAIEDDGSNTEGSRASSATVRCTKLGYRLAALPVAPRYARMLLAAITASAELKADHIIGHACAIVAALSVGNLTCWESVQELDEGKTAMLENELVRAQREAQRRLDEATKKQAPKWSQLRDDAEGLLWLMGGYAWAARGGETAAESFCQQNKINPRQMAEAHSLMQQLAELLQRRLSLSETELELQLPLLPKPPNSQQALLLRECIVEGLLDRVAVACPDLGNRAYICADLGREHPVFIHTSSNAFRHRPHPSALVFNEIISTHKHFMRDCVTVDPLQLAKRAAAGGCPLLQLGEFLPVPGPRYLSEQDKVLAFASPLYAPLSYSLPTVEVDVPSESNFRYKVFAKALLEGAVVRGLPSQDKLLARPSLLLHAPTNPRVSAVVSPLWQFRVGSRRQLIAKWRSDRRFLLEGYLKWLPSSMHDDVRLAWPPLGKN